MTVIGRRPITAAASKVTVSTNDPSKQVKESPIEDRLWDAYDRLPELHFGSNTRANIARRFDYFPARRATPVSEPERIGEVDEGETVPAADKAIVDVFEMEGGADLLRYLTAELVIHWDVTGKAYVVAEGAEGSRVWKVYSTRELKKRTDGNYDRMNSSGEIQDETVPIDADNVFVVWRPHPRNSRKPDSPLRSSLEVAEQLILLNREMRARSMSRIAAGILFISDGMDFADSNDENMPVEEIEKRLMDRLTRPIADVGSAGSVAPWVWKANIEDIEAARHMTFDRDWEVSREDREELRKRLAVGMDMPPEVIDGIADLNHWSAWQVQETTVSQHVDPTVRTILDSLTTGWFIPILEATNGITEEMVEGVVLWRDLTPAVVPADNSDQHFTALRAGLIGFDATRERLGYDLEEAPSMEELELIGWLVGRGNPSTGVPVDIDGEEPDGTPIVPDDDGPDQSDPLPESEDDREASAPVAVFQHTTAPASRTINLGDLTVQDQATLEYVLVEAEAAIDRLEEKAAARIRSKTQGRSAFAHLRDLPDPDLLHATVGQFTTNELIKDDDLTPIIARIRRRLARAQDQARDTFAELVEAEPQPRSLEEDTDLDDGLSMLTLILLTAAAAALVTPGAEPDPVDVGEVRDLRVPVTEIRDALSTVGGGIPEYSDTVSWELIGNGRRTQQRLSNVGASSLEYQWLYGDPASRVSNFDPHRRLNGTTFTEWDDPALSVTADGSWVGVSHYRPGDHRGCLCQYQRTVTLPLPVAASG